MKAKENNPEQNAMNVRKSNTLIQSIGKTTLLSNKLFLTALLKVEKREGCSDELKGYYKKLENLTGADFSHGLVAEFTNMDMRSFMTKSGSYYKAIGELMDSNSSESLKKQWGIMVHNQEDGLYGFVDVITAMIYDSKNGKILVKFSDEKRIQEEIYNLKKNYTLLDYRVMMSFKSEYSYRIYEMILSRIGYDDWKSNGMCQEYSYEYGLSEIKYMLGILDPFITPEVKEAITMARTAEDFERIEECITKERKKIRFNDFERYTLKRAVTEINSINNAEYEFGYTAIRSGRGGKIKGVRITAKRLTTKDEWTVLSKSKAELTEEEKDDLYDKIRDLIKEKLKSRDVKAIAESAEYNFEKIKAAYDVASASSKDVSNLVGFMISAIKNGYEAPVAKKGKRRKNGFNNFEQKEVDYDAIAAKKVRKRMDFELEEVEMG